MWGAWLCETKTGTVGPALDLAGGRVSHTLNGVGDWSLTCDGAQFDGLARRWWYPWAASVLIAYRRSSADPWQPVILGPVTGLPTASAGLHGETGMPVTLTGQDMRAMLARRIITGWRDWPAPDSTWEIQHEALSLAKMSLGTIGEKLVAIGTSRRFGGGLPIRYDPALWQASLPDDEGHQRRYEAYNLANNGVSKLLDDLSNCEGGPDFVFQPQCNQQDGRVTRAWVLMRHGVEGQPQIPQRNVQVWDSRLPGSAVSGLSVTATAADMYNRHWATGDGQDADVLMDVRQNDAQLSAGMPLMETVASYSSIVRHSSLLSHIDASLIATAAPTLQWSATIDMPADGMCPGADWFLGERVVFLAPPTRATALFTGEQDRAYPPMEVDVLATITGMQFDLSNQCAIIDLQED